MSPEQFSQQVKVQRTALVTLGFVVSVFSILLLSGCAGLPADDVRAQIKAADHYAAPARAVDMNQAGH
jgi:hypothetical protein